MKIERTVNILRWKRLLFPVLAAAVMALALTGPAAPASAVTCPSGSTTFDTQGSPQVAQNADNFGSGAKTCFSDTGSNGQLTVTQADHSGNPVNPTSYPSDDYGCTASFCTNGWTSEDWNQSSNLKISASFSNTGVDSHDVYDYLLDSLFTAAGNTGTGPPTSAEVEVVLNAQPSYSAAGFCVATSCGATSVSIDGASWWRSSKTSSGGWNDYVYVRATQTSSVTNLNLTNFFTDADTFNCVPACILGNLQTAFPTQDMLLASTWAGTELWPRTAGDGGLGLTVNSESVTNEP